MDPQNGPFNRVRRRFDVDGKVVKFETKKRVTTPDENYLPRRGPTLEIGRKGEGTPSPFNKNWHPAKGPMSFAAKGKESVVKFETKKRVTPPDENYLPRRGPTLEIDRKGEGTPSPFNKN